MTDPYPSATKEYCDGWLMIDWLIAINSREGSIFLTVTLMSNHTPTTKDLAALLRCAQGYF